MRYAFDIGGVISKHPEKFRIFLRSLVSSSQEVFIITDMHKREEVPQMLKDNGFDFIPEDNVRCADYTNHGEFCKAILLKQLNIDFFFDDFVGYIQWDSTLGPAPVRFLMAPDGLKPYWANDWKVRDNLDFGRRVTSLDALKEAGR